MKNTDEKYGIYLSILKEELVPAMGCTEPIAIAYAASLAKKTLGSIPERVEVQVSNNIIKNVKSVIVPNTNGLKGIEASAAAGIIAGNADKILEVISSVSDEQKIQIKNYLHDVPIKISKLVSPNIFDILIDVYYGNESAEVRITDFHTNVVLIRKNSEIILSKSEKSHCSELTEESENLSYDKLTIKDILDFAETVNIEDIKTVMDKQIIYNSRIAEEGLQGNYGANIGSTILINSNKNIRALAIAKAAAASDARMAGCDMPVVINSGSGNQGIAVSIPVIVYAKEMAVELNTLYRALVLANLLAIYEKIGIGRLSAYCGAVSAGCAAGCGISYLNGGGLKEIEHTLVNSVAIVSGIICDGAKPSCAAKIAMSVEAGILGYNMYNNGQEFKSGDGIVDCSATKTIENVGRLGKKGMHQTDIEIVKIMLKEE